MKSATLACYGLLMLFLFSACKKDDDPSGTPPPKPPSDYQIDLSGSVIGINGEFIAGAAVNYRDQTTTTDSRGIFRFRNVPAAKGQNYVEVSQQGYFFGGKSFYVFEKNEYSVNIQLLPRSLTGAVQAAEGGSVTAADGIGLSLPANAIAGGYQGEVRIYTRFIDPTAVGAGLQMPGLEGLNADGELGVLRSFGMAHFELEDASGNVLQLAEGMVATITMPVPADLLSSANATIPLWYYDQQIGIWKEEGSATLQGNTYVGDVSHFSMWNCDVWNCGTVYTITYTCNGLPISNLLVTLRVEQWATTMAASGRTDADGKVSTFMPCNEEVKFYATPSGSDEEFFIGSIYVDSQGQEVVDFSMASICWASAGVKGSAVDPEGNPVTNGYLYLQFDGIYTDPLWFDDSGNFETYFFSFDPEFTATEAQIVAWNLDNFTTAQGPAVPFNQQMNVLSQPIMIGGSSVSLDGRIYVASTDPYMLHCLDASDGSVIWTFIGGNMDRKVSPVFLGGLILYYTLSGEYVCLNAFDATPLWTHFIVGSNSPFAESGTFYTSASGGRIRSNNIFDASLNWMYESNSTSLISAPTVVGDVLYTGLGNNPTGLLALDKSSGDLLWQFETATAVKHSPCVVDGTVYFGSIDQNFYALNASNGNVIWQTNLGSGTTLLGNPTAGNGLVYIQTQNHLKALNMSNGSVAWEKSISSGTTGTDPFLKGDRLYAAGLSDPLTCYNAQTGAEIWQAANGSRYFIVVGDMLIMQRGPAPRTLVALNALNGQPIWTSEAERNFNHPMVVVDDNGTAHYTTLSGMRQ